jgi:hypothetical protein
MRQEFIQKTGKVFMYFPAPMDCKKGMVVHVYDQPYPGKHGVIHLAFIGIVAKRCKEGQEMKVQIAGSYSGVVKSCHTFAYLLERRKKNDTRRNKR